MSSIDRLRAQMFQRAGRELLTTHLETTYGVGVASLTKLDGDVYRVDRGDGSTWVARLFAAARSIDRAEGDAEVLRFLEGHDYPAEQRAHPEPVSILEGQAVLVTDYVEGVPADDGSTTLQRLGAMLGRLHTLPVDASGAPARAAGSLHHWSAVDGAPRAELATANELIADAGASVSDAQRSSYESLRELIAGADDCDGLPRAFIHPDFNQGNVIATPDGSLVVIDWTGAGCGPRVSSLAGLLYLAVVGHHNAPHRGADLDRVEPVIAGYRTYVELDDNELARLSGALQARPLILECSMFALWNKPLADTLRQTAVIIDLADAIAARTREAFARA